MGWDASPLRARTPGCHTQAEALRKRGRVVSLPPFVTSTHLPPLFLSAGGQALVCLLAGMRSIHFMSLILLCLFFAFFFLIYVIFAAF